ncbi:MAG TPA: MFS transporter [Rubrobacteraceae bacterium]|jgi:MFS family permease|nr:MFS transporter [Rubrobacteraceae bacterium]
MAKPTGEPNESAKRNEELDGEGSILRQPKAVWAVAFACVISFMGLGLVDPILPAIGDQLNASPSQVELLFSSYILVTGLAMIITGVVSSRLGHRRTLLAGLGLIVVFSALSGASGSLGEIVGFRAGWGLGNALFIATALAVIVEVSGAGTEKAVILYEAALGLGISVGPLLGGALGGLSWRGPFFGVALLMSVGFVAIFFLLPPIYKVEHKSSVLDPIRALKHRGLLTLGLTALCYNFGFFTMLAYTPFPLRLDAHGLGLVFFGWGVLLAITSVFLAPRIQARLGTLPTICAMLFFIALDLLIMGLGISSHPVLIVAVIVGGGFLGVNNTLITTAVMEASPVERPVASAAYSFIRFVGGAIAPFLAGVLAEWFVPSVPFYVGAAAVAASIAVLFSGRSYLKMV